MTFVSKYGLKRFHRPVLLIHLINIANSHGTEPYHGVMLMIGQADTKQLKILKMIYHPLYGMNNYVLKWGDWLSCDPLRGSHDSQSPHIRKHLRTILWQL